MNHAQSDRDVHTLHVPPILAAVAVSNQLLATATENQRARGG